MVKDRHEQRYECIAKVNAITKMVYTCIYMYAYSRVYIYVDIWRLRLQLGPELEDGG